MNTEGPIHTKAVRELIAISEDVAAVRTLVNEDSNSISPSSPV